MGCGIAESNIRQYAERYGRHSNEGIGCAERGDLVGLQRVLDEMRTDGTPLDCSFSIGQQTVVYAPIGDRTMTPENVLLVRAWLFDPSNSIPLMIQKLAGNFHSSSNPGATEEERIMAALARYNSGQWVIPPAFAGNVANYQQALIAADEILGAT